MRLRLVLVALMSLSFQARTTAQAAERPNVVVILADDQGWGDLSAHGNTNLRTPRIDSLARDGVLFERFFVCPVCSPTRAEFLTGRYHPRGGVRGVSTGGERLDLDETTIADVFKKNKYATGAFGKWHNGTQYPYHPNARGFDEYYGFTSGHWGDYFSPPLEHNGQIVRGNGFIIDDLADHAIAFLRENCSRPFFCYVPFNTPHSPMQVPDRNYDRLKSASIAMRAEPGQVEDVETTRVALAMCENIDENVGRILDALDELKIAEKTIVAYFSDNGPAAFRWNGGMRGKKGTTDEGGVRSPLLVRWPGHIPAGSRVETIAAAIDLLPTLAELAGLTVPQGKQLDGVSLAGRILGRTEEPRDRVIFSHWAGRVSARDEQYRLDDRGRLYDMKADPGQARDMASMRPEAATRLREAVAAWRRDVLSEMSPGDDRPFPVGHPEFPATHLPARDGVPSGHIRRSAPAPNCSYFTGWTSTDDAMTWDVDVVTSGKYEAIIYYTCEPNDVGVALNLSLAGQVLRAKVNEAHDPPARGAEHDRVPRHGESLVKDFRPLMLGTLELKQGRRPLRLTADEIPGQKAIEVRGLTLKLIP